MPKTNLRTTIPLAALFLLVSGSLAGAQQGQVDIQGTDSAGSFSHDAPAASQSASPAEEAPAKKEEGSRMRPGHPPMHPHGQKEGSRPYAHGDPHKKKECDKDKERKEGSGHAKGHPHPHHPHAGKGHGSYGQSQGGHGGHGRNPFAHVLRFKGKLGLTDGQVEAMKDAEFEYQKERVQARADHKIAHMELEKLAHSGDVDDAAMRAAAGRIAASKTRSINAMVEAKIALLKILTPEQRQKMAAMHAAHSGH